MDFICPLRVLETSKPPQTLGTADKAFIGIYMANIGIVIPFKFIS